MEDIADHGTANSERHLVPSHRTLAKGIWADMKGVSGLWQQCPRKEEKRRNFTLKELSTTFHETGNTKTRYWNGVWQATRRGQGAPSVSSHNWKQALKHSLLIRFLQRKHSSAMFQCFWLYYILILLFFHFPRKWNFWQIFLKVIELCIVFFSWQIIKMFRCSPPVSCCVKQGLPAQYPSRTISTTCCVQCLVTPSSLLWGPF